MTPMTIATSEPFKLITMDFLTTSSCPSGYHYILVFVDYFTNFSVVVPTEDQTALTMATLFWEHVVQAYGCP